MPVLFVETLPRPSKSILESWQMNLNWKFLQFLWTNSLMRKDVQESVTSPVVTAYDFLHLPLVFSLCDFSEDTSSTATLVHIQPIAICHTHFLSPRFTFQLFYQWKLCKALKNTNENNKSINSPFLCIDHQITVVRCDGRGRWLSANIADIAWFKLCSLN